MKTLDLIEEIDIYRQNFECFLVCNLQGNDHFSYYSKNIVIFAA